MAVEMIGDEEQQIPVRKTRDEMVFECYGIDGKELELERQAMLEEVLHAEV